MFCSGYVRRVAGVGDGGSGTGWISPAAAAASRSSRLGSFHTVVPRSTSRCFHCLLASRVVFGTAGPGAASGRESSWRRSDPGVNETGIGFAVIRPCGNGKRVVPAVRKINSITV